MHVPFEGPGYLEDWCKEKGLDLRIWQLFHDAVLPDPEEVDLLIVMGGPMNIYEHEKYPWLGPEKELLTKCLAGGSRMLGICLGAQLLADMLGEKVYREERKEIGWYPVSFEKGSGSDPLLAGLPDVMTAFHWHGETFDIPADASRIASSEACMNQGFLYREQVLALQFHLEVTPSIVKGLLHHGRNELQNGPFIQDASDILGGLSHCNRNREALFGILDRWLKREIA